MANLKPSRGESQRGNLTTQTSQQARHPLQMLREEMNSLFDRFFGYAPMSLEEDFGPMRMWDFGTTENDQEITVRAELPGFDPNDLDVQLHDNVLTIKAEKREEKGDGQSYRTYRRMVTLPPGVDAERVDASYKNGVLELHIAKTESGRGKRIAIRGEPAPKQLGSSERSASASEGATRQGKGKK